MTDTTNVVIKVDSSQARAANRDVLTLNNNVAKLITSLGKLSAPMVSAAKAMDSLGKVDLSASQKQLEDLKDAGAQASAALQKSVGAGAAASVGQATDNSKGAAATSKPGAIDEGAEAAVKGFVKGTVDLVNNAFVDVFKNIDHGFKGFSAKLITGFKQLLADLVGSFINPVIAKLTTGLAAKLTSALGFGSIAGDAADKASSGGVDITSLLKGAGSITSKLGDAIASGWSNGDGFFGGLKGAASSASDYVSGLFGSSGGAAGSHAADYSGAQYNNWVNAQTNSTWSGAGSSFGALAGGVTGFISGYQANGLKGGIVSGAAGWGGATAGTMLGTAAATALSGTALGATIGSILPGIGTLIGAALGSMLGNKLFAGQWTTKDQGLQLDVTNGDFTGQQFEYQKKKGGLLHSNKKRTRLTALDPTMQKGFDDTFDATEDAVQNLFEMLNVQLNDGVLDGLNVASIQISTKDKTAEQVQTEVAAWFSKVADASVLAISDATQADTRGFTFETLTTFVKNLYGVNDVLKNLNVGLFQTSVQGGFMAEQLSLLAGGFDKLSSGAATYYDKFFSDTEKADNVLTAVGKEFKDLGVNLPSSRDAYRDLVESQDITTESGRSMLAKLITLAGDASAAYDILESRAKAAQDAALAAQEAALAAATTSVNNAFSAVQRAVAAEQKNVTDAYNARVGSLNDMAATAQKSISDMTGISNALANALKALRGTSSDAVKMLRNQAQATLQAALATARSGGSVSSVSGLDDALSTVSSNTTDLYGSLEDFNRDQGRTANVVAELNGLTNSQLSTEEQLLATVQDQIKSAKDQYDDEMAKLDQQLDTAQKQLDALNGVDNSVISVAQAIANLGATISAAAAVKSAVASGSVGASPVLNSGSGGAPSPNDLNSLYQSVLGRDADPAGMMYWAGQLGSGAQTAATIANAIRNDAIKNGEIPRYAAGGMFGGGLRLVGENGPELEVTGPSRIYSANQTASMLNGSGSVDATVAELRQLRVEIHNDLSQIARYSEKTAYGIRQQNESGIALQEVAA
jgi:hypothetical protein